MALLMNLPGITGEGSVQEHIGWHALAGFTWGGTRVSRANAAGSHRGATRVWAPQLRSATARRKADSQSALVWLGMVGTTEFPIVKFEWLRTGQGTPICYFALELGGVRIARISEDSSGDHPMETIEFLYRTITLGVRDVGNALSGAQDIVTYQIPTHAGG